MKVKTCLVCGRQFTRYFNLRRHIDRIHPDWTHGNFEREPESMCSVQPRQQENPVVAAAPSSRISVPFTFLHPFTAVLAGPSSCGKTTLLLKILERRRDLIRPAPARVVWYYKRWQPAYDDLLKIMPEVDFREGLPDPPDYDRNPTLLILDDLMSSAGNSDVICNLFTEGSHHLNVSVFFLTQNVFYQSKHNRSIQMNASYLILFKNPRNKLQPAILGRHMYPTNWHEFVRKYERATAQPFGYLLIDLKQDTPDDKRLVVDVIKDEERPRANVIRDSEDSRPIPEDINMEPNRLSPPCKRFAPTQQQAQQPPAEFPGQSYWYPPAWQTPLYQQAEQTHAHPCDECGLMFSNEKSKDRHGLVCGREDKEPEPMDDTVWQEWKREVREEENDPSEQTVKKELMKKYKRVLEDWYALERSEYHRNINDDIRSLIFDRKVLPKEAIRKTLKENKAVFDDIVQSDDDSDDELDSEKEDEPELWTD